MKSFRHSHTLPLGALAALTALSLGHASAQTLSCPIPTPLQSPTGFEVFLNNGSFCSPCGGSLFLARVFTGSSSADYLGWCIDVNTEILPSLLPSEAPGQCGIPAGFPSTSLYGAPTVLDTAAVNNPVFNEINYLLNHAAGDSPDAIQVAIWTLLGQSLVPDDFAFLPSFAQSAPYPAPACAITTSVGWSQVNSLVADAQQNGANFQAGPGEIRTVMVTSPGVQSLLLEVACPASNPGTGTPGYWKTHASAWPVSSIVIGGISYTRNQAINLMKLSVQGDKTLNLFDQLVSAELNLMIGNDATCVSDAIADADAFLALHPAGSGVAASSPAWASVADAFNILGAYNNGQLCAPHRN